MKLLALIVLMAACGDDTQVPPDAPPSLRCAQIGCTPTPDMCHPDGWCTCPHPDGRPGVTLDCLP